MKLFFLSKNSLLILIFTLSSCLNTEIKNEEIIKSKNLEEIIIDEDYALGVPSDSLFSSFEVIKLEATPRSLIKEPRRVSINSSHIYVQDENRRLLQFSLNGDYLRDIGNLGQGPNEFISLAGYDIDNSGLIYLIDYKKILVFNDQGIFQNEIQFDFNKLGIECYPEQLYVTENSEIFLWGGTMGLNGNSNNKIYALFRLNNEYELDYKYLPLSNKTFKSYNRFYRNSTECLIEPYFGNDTVFSIFNNRSIKPKYYINFGKNKISENIPKLNNNNPDAIRKIFDNYACTIRRFIEINDWVYFTFLFNRYQYHVYYSKKLKKSFVYRPSRDSEPIKSFVWKVDNGYNNSFISLIEPSFIKELYNKVENPAIANSKYKELYYSLKDVTLLDNPILIITKMQ